MSRPNRNGILSCRDCGELVHLTHTKDGRCEDCRGESQPDRHAGDDYMDSGSSGSSPPRYGDYVTREVSEGVHSFEEIEEIA